MFDVIEKEREKNCVEKCNGFKMMDIKKDLCISDLCMTTRKTRSALQRPDKTGN